MDPESQHLHGTPSSVWRKADGKRYFVGSIYFDGDRGGLCVVINLNGTPFILAPGEYRTHAIYFYKEENERLEIRTLD